MADSWTVNGVPQARNMKKIGGLDDLPGGGQVMVRGDYAYIGHMSAPHDTTVIDVSDPKSPKVVATVEMDLPSSHSHKTRVAGDLMITNVERVGPENDDYKEGGFRIYDASNPAEPKFITHVRTHARGVHRFDMDENYAYMSTEMEGFVGNILVTYDLSNPAKPTEVSRWWMDGQNVAAGETPSRLGNGHRLHHAMRYGDKMWAACWDSGFRIVDIADMSNPKTVGRFDHHPTFKHPTHTLLPLAAPVKGRDIAVMMDEEAVHRPGMPHAALWTFDVSDVTDPIPLAMFEVSERDTPFYRADTARGGGHGHGFYRFGAHQFQEHLDDTRVFAVWFSGGLRVIDVADPDFPEEIAYYVPTARGDNAAPQSNDVDTDARGLIYVLDRFQGLDILEMEI